MQAGLGFVHIQQQIRGLQEPVGLLTFQYMVVK
jgi:hypothetical protein